MVGVGGVRPGPDDDEVGAGVAFGEDRGVDLRADLGFGAPGAQPVGDLGVDAVDRGGGGAQGVELGGVLAGAELGEDGPGQDLFGLRDCGVQPEGVDGVGVVADRDTPGLWQALGDQGEGVLPVGPGSGPDPQVVETEVFVGRELEVGHDQVGGLVVGGDQQGGEPVAGAAGGTDGGADEVGQVGPGDDEQGIQVVGRRGAARPLEPLAVPPRMR